MTVSAADSGAEISCRAVSPKLPKEALEDIIMLHVLRKYYLVLFAKKIQNQYYFPDLTPIAGFYPISLDLCWICHYFIELINICDLF